MPMQNKYFEYVSLFLINIFNLGSNFLLFRRIINAWMERNVNKFIDRFNVYVFIFFSFGIFLQPWEIILVIISCWLEMVGEIILEK